MLMGQRESGVKAESYFGVGAQSHKHCTVRLHGEKATLINVYKRDKNYMYNVYKRDKNYMYTLSTQSTLYLWLEVSL